MMENAMYWIIPVGGSSEGYYQRMYVGSILKPYLPISYEGINGNLTGAILGATRGFTRKGFIINMPFETSDFYLKNGELDMEFRVYLGETKDSLFMSFDFLYDAVYCLVWHWLFTETRTGYIVINYKNKNASLPGVEAIAIVLSHGFMCFSKQQFEKRTN